MSIETALATPEGQRLIAEVAQAFGADEHKTADAVEGLADEVRARIERSMLSRGGVADVVSLVTDPSASHAFSDPKAFASGEAITDGNHILDVLIGNKHVSRGIAARAASQSGLDAATVEKMLPVVAGLLIAGLQKRAEPAFSKLLSDVPSLAGGAYGSPLPMPGDRIPTGGYSDDAPLPSPSARNGSGMPAGPVDGGSPLPLPGNDIPGLGRSRPRADPDDNPYQRLPDIVRRGGERVPGPDGGSLENVIRSILGQLLGSNSGVIGTMIKLFLLRWLASFARRILSRVLTGR